MIRKVWKTYNVSFVLILSLFNDITKDTKFKNSSAGFPFIQLCIEYGIIDSFLYADNKKRFDGNLYLSFDRDIVNKNRKLTDSKYDSITERIIDCNYYNGMIIRNDVITFKLKVPKEFHPDIQLIENNHYSKVSKDYKERLKIREKRVPYSPGKLSSIGTYITSNDLAYAICVKGSNIRDELQGFLGTSILISNEFYVPFNKSKEVLDYSKMIF